MALTAVWLAATPDPVYGHYLRTLGSGAIHDQRLAATVMFAGSLPAFFVWGWMSIGFPSSPRKGRATRSRRTTHPSTNPALR
jgi:hypothetical protein